MQTYLRLKWVRIHSFGIARPLTRLINLSCNKQYCQRIINKMKISLQEIINIITLSDLPIVITEILVNKDANELSLHVFGCTDRWFEAGETMANAIVSILTIL